MTCVRFAFEILWKEYICVYIYIWEEEVGIDEMKLVKY